MNTVVVINGNGGWGKGSSLAQAFKNCPYKKGKPICIARAYNCDESEVTVDDNGAVHSPGTSSMIYLGRFTGTITEVKQ